MNEEQLKDLAQSFTMTLAKSGASKEDALLVVLNMLNYHAGLVMGEADTAKLIDQVKKALRHSQWGQGKAEG